MARFQDGALNLVVVGASAGGVQALSQLVRGLPTGLAAAVLIVLHIPASAPSALANILARAGLLPTVTAGDGDLITHGCIYVAPAAQHMLVAGRRIVLSDGPAEHGHRPGIDPLFRSAARSGGPRVIGVVLSGTQDDGAAGLLEIVERGGTAVVQDPDTALYRSMPCAAMNRLTVDHVLPPAQIGGLLAELVNRRPGDTGLPADEQLTVGLESLSFASDLRGVGRDIPSCPEACGDRDQS